MKATKQSPHRILLVEDNDFIASAFTSFLTSLCPHAQLTRANSVQEARTILENSDFPLIFLDDNLPDGNGYELLGTLSVPPHAVSRVVSFTGHPPAEDRSIPHRQRLDGHVNKTELQAGLKWWLNQAEFPNADGSLPPLPDGTRKFQQMAQQELQAALTRLETLLTEDDTKAIAAQAHSLVGLAGLLHHQQLRQICETIEETASLGQLEASRKAWLFLRALLTHPS